MQYYTTDVNKTTRSSDCSDARNVQKHCYLQRYNCLSNCTEVQSTEVL